MLNLIEFLGKPNESLGFSYSCHSVRSFIQSFSLSKEEAHTTVLLIGIRKEARSQVLHLSRNKRYTLTPEKLKWDKFKLTYKYLFTACDAQKQYKLGKGRANISAKRNRDERPRLQISNNRAL